MINITEDLLKGFIAFSPIDTAIYRVRNGALETLFLSENIPGLLGMTREEYLKITQKDAMDLTVDQDRAGLAAATMNCIVTGQKLDYYYRVFSNIKGFDWVHADAHVCGTMGGDTVIIARFANVSREGGIFDMILNHSDRAVLVINRDTDEILYCNDRFRELTKIDMMDLLRTKCHTALLGRNKACRECFIAKTDDEEIHEKQIFDEKAKKWYGITWKNTSWCMKDAAIIYIKDVTEEKNYEISLDRMNQMYQKAVEDAKEMMWEYDPQKRTVTYQLDNPYTRAVCRKTGMPAVIENAPESIIGMVDEQYREGFTDLFNMDHMKKQGNSFEYSSTVNGDTQWWRVTGRPIYDLDRKVKSVFCSGINITDRKQAESNYRSLLTQFSDIKNVGIANFRLNVTKNTFVSGYSIYPYLNEHLGTRTAEEHFEIAVGDIADPAIKDRAEKIFTCAELTRQYKQGVTHITLEYPVRSRQQATKGQIRWFKLIGYLVANPDTGDIEDVNVVTEITKQKKNENMLNFMASEGCDYIGLVDVAVGVLEIFNGSWEFDIVKNSGSMGYAEAADELMKLHIAQEDRRQFAEQTALSKITGELETAKEVLVHYDYVGDDGNRLKKRIKFKWIDEEKKELLVVQEDITESYIKEQKQMAKLQAALKSAEVADNAKTEFVSRISHDIRTPISAIISMTDFAMEDADDIEKLKGDIGKISDSSQFLLSLINDILDISKIDSGKIELHPEPYPFEEFMAKIRSMFETLCIQKQLEFEVINKRESEAVAVVDKVRFDQISMNLISNAVKYTPQGGKVTYISNSSVTPDGMVKCSFTVSDTGIGMSREFQGRMFDVFAQEANTSGNLENGTGLGLSIVKKIVDLMGGTVNVKSAPGAGTSVSINIILPKATKEQLEEISEKSRKKKAPKGHKLRGKVLLAEDNAINTEIALRLLEEFGLNADHADNGKTAAEKFMESAENEYCAILMDIRMPVADGYTATELIRKMPRNDAATVPVIAMTADAFDESRRKAEKAGINDYVTKPIEPERLFDVLSSYIETKK